MISVFARIGLRYLAGVLIAKGLLPDHLGNEISLDPDLINLVEVGIGLAAGAVAEGWYYIARKMGWEK